MVQASQALLIFNTFRKQCTDLRDLTMNDQAWTHPGSASLCDHRLVFAPHLHWGCRTVSGRGGASFKSTGSAGGHPVWEWFHCSALRGSLTSSLCRCPEGQSSALQSTFHGFTIQSEAIVSEQDSQRPFTRQDHNKNLPPHFIIVGRGMSYCENTHPWKFLHIFHQGLCNDNL